MTYRVLVLPAARQDSFEASDWYEDQRPGLGARFEAELEVAIERTVASPFRYPVALEDIRRIRLSSFPYVVFYRVLDEAIFIMAILHTRRHPSTWQRRPREPN